MPHRAGLPGPTDQASCAARLSTALAPGAAPHFPGKRSAFPGKRRGLRVFSAGNLLKSRSMVHSSVTPCARQSAAIRASCTSGPSTFPFFVVLAVATFYNFVGKTIRR